MIIGSDYPLDVGERYVGVVDADLKTHPDQPFWVVRAATYEEWEVQYKSKGHTPANERSFYDKCYFYLISVD